MKTAAGNKSLEPGLSVPAAVEELEARLDAADQDESRCHNDECCSATAWFIARDATALARRYGSSNESLARALRRYAWHNEFCDQVANGIDGDCQCGLNAALAAYDQHKETPA